MRASSSSSAACSCPTNKSYGIALEQLKKKIGFGSRRKSWQTQSHFKYRSKTFATNFNVIILHTTCLTPISHADVDHSQGFQSSAFSPPAVELPLALQELPAKESVLQFDGQAHVFVKKTESCLCRCVLSVALILTCISL